MKDFLKGKKTYILAVLGGIYAALIGLEVVPSLDFVWALLGTGAVATLRAGVAAVPAEANKAAK